MARFVFPKTLAVVFCVVPGLLALEGRSLFGAIPFDVFQGFTRHINQQIIIDKREFVEAESCTQWFYRQLKKRRVRPEVERLSFSPADFNLSQCQNQYPNGLDGARTAFSETQSSLSLSLTFYQFALVGDKNDDGAYSLVELKDVIECFGMVFDGQDSPFVHLTTLNKQFDVIREAREFSALTKGMEILFQKGYRFTDVDQAVLNDVLG